MMMMKMMMMVVVVVVIQAAEDGLAGVGFTRQTTRGRLLLRMDE